MTEKLSIHALVFDFDGLILDTETPELIAWQETYAAHEASLTLEAWIDCVGRPPGSFDPCVHLERLIGREIDHDAVRTATRDRARNLVAEESLRPGVIEWLDEAAALGMRLGVASSSTRSWVTGHLERLGIGNRFETFVCNEDVERHKPDPEPYRLAVDRLGADPSSSIAVEDSPHGLRSARAAGLWCIAVPNRVTRLAVRGLADLELSSLGEVPLSEAIDRLAHRGVSV